MDIKKYVSLLIIISISTLAGCDDGGGGGSSLLLGSGTGNAFVEGTLEIKINSIDANGSTVVSAYVVDNNNALSAQSHSVEFSSNCAVQSLATFSSTTVTTSFGIASTTYTDQG
jgi:hypothetical protein